MSKRNVSLILVGLFVGAAIGGVLGNLFAWILPQGVVKDFFLTSVSLDIGGLAGNDIGVIILDLKILTLKFGLAVNFNFTSVIGIGTAYYILRYFR
tara:strand:+ start:48086 stop:48373 length:288 start_codon:yes stop_codon:yes gene_type:complete